MQVLRLIQAGRPDRILAFDSLPAEFMATLKTSPASGLPRHWGKWLKENGSVDKAGNPAFYLCDYIGTNNDREAWQNISQYVRKAVETSVRLLDKLEDMGSYMARDSRTELELEPEDIAIIPVPKQEMATTAASTSDTPEAPVVRRGRRPKETSHGTGL